MWQVFDLWAYIADASSVPITHKCFDQQVLVPRRTVHVRSMTSMYDQLKYLQPLQWYNQRSNGRINLSMYRSARIVYQHTRFTTSMLHTTTYLHLHLFESISGTDPEISFDFHFVA